MTRSELNLKRLELITNIRKLNKKSSCTVISKHNTILALRNSVTKEVSHLIEKDNVKVLSGNINELYVPRYEPKVAKEWLNAIDEEFEITQSKVQEDIGYRYEKCLLSVSELRTILISRMKANLLFIKRLSKLSDMELIFF